MVKKLIQHGKSAALVIDKPIMEMLRITNETLFELSTDGKYHLVPSKYGCPGKYYS